MTRSSRVDPARTGSGAAQSPPLGPGMLVPPQSLIWDRTRHVLRLRSTLREYFPAALQAFPDLAAPEALELLGRAPDPTGPPG
jgi:hypothetical protein